jgi:hypothetical protein
MRRRPAPPGETASPISIKVAWWVAFLATLALVFALAQAKAQALSVPTPLGPVPVLAEEDDEDELGAEDGDEEGWEYDEECEFVGEDEEEEFCEETEGDDGTPPECLLSSAEATVSAIPARDTVRLSVRYTARSSAAVKVELFLRGGKGPLSLGEDRKRFERKGTFRQTERLTEDQMKKVVAARNFTVELQAVNTPRYCHRYFDQKLTVKRASGAGLTWQEPAARASARADG